MTGRVTGGNKNNSPESGTRLVLSFESRVACQPAEHKRWKFSESDGSLRPADYHSSDPDQQEDRDRHLVVVRVAAAAVVVNSALPGVPPASQEEKSVGCHLVPLGKGSRGADFWMANHDHVVLATWCRMLEATNALSEKANVLGLTPACFISSVYKIRPVWMSASSRAI